MENIIEIKNVTKEFKVLNRREDLKGSLQDLFSRDYKVIRAVDNISMNVKQGEIVGYLGSNGAGKSTTIKMMTGVLEPTSGEILVDGILPYQNRTRNAQEIGVVFGQRSQLWWALPLVESLRLLKDIYQIEDADYRRMLELYQSLVDIEPLLHKPVRQMSLGQRTLSDILAAFLHNPKIVFLDEPTIGLDVSMKARIRTTIGMIFTNIAGFVSFWILFGNFPSINGWSYYEILFLYGFSLISLTPVQCFFDNNWSLRMYVYSGDFIKYCFRPINLFFYYQSEVFDAKGLGQLAFGAGTLIYAWNRIGLPCTPLAVLKTLVFLITASLIMIAMQNAAAATCFWIQNSFYVLDLTFKFKDYAKYPVTIFSPVFRFVFTFIIPIAFIAYYPSLVLLRPEEVPVLSWISPFVGCVFFYLSYKFWMYSAMKYSGTGS